MSKNDNVSDNIFQKQGINEITSGNLSTAAQFPRLNKLKIVGNGMNNWSVATCGPFYLIDTDQNSSNNNNNPATSNDNVPQPLTGATNLITHYGLLSTYHKFCGKPFKETLSSFLPNITGNLDVPASENGSSLMSLSNKPPVQKEISTFSNNSLTDAFRLYNEKLPQCAHWFSNQAQNPITFDDKSKHRSSESKKRKRRDSNLTTSFTELPPTTTTTVSSSNQMPVNNNISSDTSQLLTNPSSNVHENNSISQHIGISTTAKIGLNDNSNKMISPGSSLFSNQNPPPVVISTLTIKPKKSKRSDDEEKKKKKKKEKKKKRERNID